jgi:hypothetical protein
MELVSVRIEESPRAAGRVRLVGEVAYDDRPETESYWFEVDEEHAGALSLSGTPWLACLLPLAVTLGQNLRISAPVDPLLAGNASRLMEIWTTWYRKRFPSLRVVQVDAPLEVSQPPPVLRETGAYFSGGIDSFYTVLHNADVDDRSESPRIDRLLWVGGFDLPLEAPEEEFRRLRSRLSAAAGDLGLRFLDVRTNLRAVRFREARWGQLSHGSALAGVGLALERQFRTLYIAATNESGNLRPWGSHPHTDPLLSTRATRFLHDGLGVRRSQKTEYLARAPVAMRALHVCFRSGSADNCCACRKCLLAMLTLEVLGASSRCSVFPRRLDLDRVRRVYLRGPAYWRLYGDIMVRAREAGRWDIARAIAACRLRYCLLKPAVTALDWLAKRRALWRIARVLRPALLDGTVR